MNVALRERIVPVEVVKRRKFPLARVGAQAAVERLFDKPPRILESVADVAPAAPGVDAPVADVVETEHQKVFRLVGDKKFEEAARLAARLINAGDIAGFLIYGHTANYRRAKQWFDEMVRTTKRSSASVIHNVTPDLAQVIIENNDGNRRVNPANLCAIMRDISGDRWDLNGSSIAISKEGKTNDGQHRAFATILTGTGIKAVIAFGLSRDSMRTVDIGRKRTGADRLHIAGEPDYIRKSAIAALAFTIYNGRSATAAETDDYFTEHADLIRRAAHAAGANMKGVGPSAAGVAAFHLLRMGYDDDDIRAFFATVRSGDVTGKHDPRKTLYRSIFDSRYTIKLSRPNWVSAFVHHFIAVKEGRRIVEVQFSKPLPEVN